MSLKLLLFTYVFGGLTFLPLIAFTVLAIAWYTLPVVNDHSKGVTKELDEKSKDTPDVSEASANFKSTGDGAASATFAVLRSYDLQGALAAFKDAEATAKQSEGNGEGSGSGESVSVYQSMYRSVFDRNRNSANPLHEDDDDEAAQRANNKARARGKVFYIVLRHGHLMLYDSHVQLEVRHVISLAHYTVSITDTEVSSFSDLEESDLFVKRSAIMLTPRVERQANGFPTQASRNQKPYYLFCANSSEKEDFYHALLSSNADPPVPRPVDPECAIKLQSALHSTSLSLETRALNALLGRIFLAIHRTPALNSFVRAKIERKIARIQKPAFIASIACHSLDLGHAAPMISNPRLKDLHISGETVLSLDLKYTGAVNLTISATAKLDLGQRFKTRMVSLLLAVVLQRVQGKMLVRIKPPPSNRIWFCFETMPEMELKIEPVVSSRQITYAFNAFILRAIESRIREVFAEGMVKPNWDDVPFFMTDEQCWRGGIWESEGKREGEEGDITEERLAEQTLLDRNAKTMSMPVLSSADPSGSEQPYTASSSGAQTPEQLEATDAAKVKRRSVASLPSHTAQVAAERAEAHNAPDRAATFSASPVRAPRSVRKPSFASPRPVVAVDDLSADAIRSEDSSPQPTRRRWIGRGAQGPLEKRDAVEAVRQVRDRDSLGREKEGKDSTSDTASGVNADDGLFNVEPEETSDTGSLRRPSLSTLSSATRTPERAISSSSSTTASSIPRPTARKGAAGREKGHVPQSSQDSSTPPQQRKTILASTAAATAAAKSWTWNAVANRASRQQMLNRGAAGRQGSRVGQEEEDTSSQQGGKRQPPPPGEPVGRGQPLPPPGVPLPGPQQKGLWSAAAAGLSGIRRRPVAAPPPPASRDGADGSKQSDEQQSERSSINSVGKRDDESDKAEPGSGEMSEQSGDTEAEGEFGPWMAYDHESSEPHAAADADANDDRKYSEPHALRAESAPYHEMPETATPIQQTKKLPPPLPRRRQASSKSEAETTVAEKSSDADHTPTLRPHKTADYRQAEFQSEARGGEIESSPPLSSDASSDEIVHNVEAKPASSGDAAQEHLAQLHVKPKRSVPVPKEEKIHSLASTTASASTIDDFDDDTSVIPAPVDAEAEETGELDIVEDIEDDETAEVDERATLAKDKHQAEDTVGVHDQGHRSLDEATRYEG